MRAVRISVRQSTRHFVCNGPAAGGAVQNVDLTRLGGVIDVTISSIGTLTNPVAIQ